MLDRWENLGRTARREALENQEEGDLTVEEARQDRLEMLESQERKVCKESPVLEGQEAQLDRLGHLDSEEKMGILDREDPEEPRGLLETRVEEELWAVRENQENQGPKALLDPSDPAASPVKMAEMDLASQDPKEGRVMKASQDSPGRRGQPVTVAPRVDLDPEETVDRGEFQGTLAYQDRRESLDTLGPTVKKGPEDLALCNVTSSRRSEITALAAMASRNAHFTPLSWRSPWTSLMESAVRPSTTCAMLSCAWSGTSPSPRVTARAEPALP